MKDWLAERFLRLFSFLDNQNIPKILLKKGAVGLGTRSELSKLLQDDLDFEDAISMLRSLSLIKRVENFEDSSFWIHILIQDVIRDAMTVDESRECPKEQCEWSLMLSRTAMWITGRPVNDSFHMRPGAPDSVRSIALSLKTRTKKNWHHCCQLWGVISMTKGFMNRQKENTSVH